MRKAGVVIGALFALFVAMAACSNNGEGERCDFDNGNDDCANGLVCVPATSQGSRGQGYGTVNPPYNTSDRCCPLPRANATHPACTIQNAILGDASPTPTDSSVPQDASTDAPADAPDGG